MITFSTIQSPTFALIEFTLQTPSLTPASLQNLQPPDMVTQDFAHKGIILSGRGPIWLYAFLVHFYHPTRMVAVFDPRLQGAVVVATHHPDFVVGQVIEKGRWKVAR